MAFFGISLAIYRIIFATNMDFVVFSTISCQIIVSRSKIKCEKSCWLKFCKVRYLQVFEFWHKGEKNHRVGIDAQVYVNEAHEKVKKSKLMAFLLVKCWKFKVFEFWHGKKIIVSE